MKHSSRKILALLLALSLCIGMMPMSIFADDAAETPVEVLEQLAENVPAVEDAADDTGMLDEETNEEPAAPAEGTSVLVDEQDKPVEQPIEQPEEETAEEEQKVDEVVAEPVAEEEQKVDEVKTEPVEEEQKAEAVEDDEVTAESEAENATPVETAAKAMTMLKAGSSEPLEYLDQFVLNYPGEELTVYATSRHWGYPVGSYITRPSKDPVREGYTFLYWSYYDHGKDGNKRSEIDFDTDRVMDPRGRYYYAIWAKDEDVITITYDFGEGFEPITKKVAKGEVAFYPNTPTPNGDYIFDGWLKDGEPFNEKTFEESMTLTAAWTEGWEVRFVSNGELVYTCYVKDGETINGQGGQLNNPGYVFDGWYHLTEDGEKDYQVIWGKTTITEDVTFTAVWVKETICTVKYFSDYPDDKADVSRIKEYRNAGSSITAPDPYKSPISFSKTFGYEFLGWKETHDDPDPNHGTVIGGGEGTVVKKRAETVQFKSAEKSLDVKDTVEETKENDIEKLYQIGDEVMLHEHVYLTAVWGPCKSVVYRTGYQDGFTFNGEALKNDEKWITYGADETEFEVSDYDAAPLKFAKPDGYVFAGWEEIVIDTEARFNEYFPGKLAEESSYYEQARSAEMAQAATRSDASVKAKSAESVEAVEAVEQAALKIIVQPYSKTNELEKLHTVVLLIAQWEEVPSYHVQYNTNYPSAANMKKDASWVDKIEITDPFHAYEYTIKDFEEVREKYANAYKEDRFVAPDGWKFIGWSTEPGTEKEVIKYDTTDLGPREVDPTADEPVVNDNNAATLPDVEPAANNNVPEQEQSDAFSEVTGDTQVALDELESKYDKVFYAQWERATTVVVYHTNFPPLGLKPGERVDSYVASDKAFTVLDFKPAFNNKYEIPDGYQFRGWYMAATQRIHVNPTRPIFRDTTQTLETITQEAVKTKESIKKDFNATDKVKDEPVFVDITYKSPAPNTTGGNSETLMYTHDGAEYQYSRVDLYAIWDPICTVYYHRVDPESALKDETQAVYKYVVSESELNKDSVTTFKAAEFSKIVELSAESDEPVTVIPGYNFVDWRLEPIGRRFVIQPEVWDEKEVEEREEKAALELKAEAAPEQAEAKLVRLVSDKKVDVQVESKEMQKEISTDLTAKDTITKEDVSVNEKETESGEDNEASVADKEKSDHVKPNKEDISFWKGPVTDEGFLKEIHLYANWEEKPYTVIWIDEGGDVRDPLTTGHYNEYDPETFDPEKEYDANKGPELKDKVAEDGTTYTFDHWEPKDSDIENTFVYEAVYVPTALDPEEDPIIHNVIWYDEGGEDELNRDVFNDGDPAPSADTYPAPEKDGKVWVRWDVKPQDNGDVYYIAVYNPVGGRPTTNPTTNTPAEDVSEIENNETPLAPATEDPVEEEGDEEVAANESPLAGFEVEPEEEDEIAEEATPLSPFTGDDRNTVVWGIVSILSLLGIVLVARKRKEE